MKFQRKKSDASSFQNCPCGWKGDAALTSCPQCTFVLKPEAPDPEMAAFAALQKKLAGECWLRFQVSKEIMEELRMEAKQNDASVERWVAQLLKAHCYRKNGREIVVENTGSWVRQTRKEHGWSRRAAARVWGLSYPYLCAIEQGRRKVSQRVLDAVNGVGRGQLDAL